VWLRGGTKTDERWGNLTTWGRSQLDRHLGVYRGEPDTRLIYKGAGGLHSEQAASCIAIRNTLVAAGLGNEPDLRPSSVAAWAGLKAFEQDGRIEEAALLLGIRSLDRAAAFIGWDWRTSRELPGSWK
jgi:integrase/recombinase XerC